MAGSGEAFPDFLQGDDQYVFDGINGKGELFRYFGGFHPSLPAQAVNPLSLGRHPPNGKADQPVYLRKGGDIGREGGMLICRLFPKAHDFFAVVEVCAQGMETTPRSHGEDPRAEALHIR